MKNAGVIFKRSLWDSRLGILAWGIGLAVTALVELLLFPSISKAFAGMTELLSSPLYRAFLGEAADAASFATPQGYIAMYMMAFVPLYLAVYAVILGLGITAGEEERGTIDILLGTPIPRWQVIVEKFAALVVIMTCILLLNSIGAMFGVLLTPELQTLPLTRLLEAAVAMLPITLLMAAFALFFSTVLRSRSLAAGLTGALIIGSYFVTNLSEVAREALSTVKQFSFYSYYSPMQTMQEGVIWPEFALLLALAVALVGLSLVAFQRRDLAL